MISLISISPFRLLPHPDVKYGSWEFADIAIHLFNGAQISVNAYIE
jgi:hypothetical protein